MTTERASWQTRMHLTVALDYRSGQSCGDGLDKGPDLSRRSFVGCQDHKFPDSPLTKSLICGKNTLINALGNFIISD